MVSVLRFLQLLLWRNQIGCLAGLPNRRMQGLIDTGNNSLRAAWARVQAARELAGRWTGISEKKGWDLPTGLSIPILVLVAGLMFNHLNSQHLLEVADNNQKDSVVREYIKEMKALLLSKEFPLLSPQAKGSKEAIIVARASTFIALAQLKGSEKERRNLVLLFLRESGLLDKR